MKKQVEFNKVKEVLTKLTIERYVDLPKQQTDQTIVMLNELLNRVENESIERWIWPDAETIFSKKNRKCLVYGYMARYF